MKKAGTTERKVVMTSMQGFVWDGTTCTVSSRFSFNIFDPTYTPTATDGYRTLPVVGGGPDEYRVAGQAILFTKPITDQSSNAASHGKSTGDALFLFNPNMYPPSTNPAVEQFPVRNVLEPSNS